MIRPTFSAPARVIPIDQYIPKDHSETRLWQDCSLCVYERRLLRLGYAVEARERLHDLTLDAHAEGYVAARLAWIANDVVSLT